MKTYKDEPIYPDKDFGNCGSVGLTKREYFAGLAMQGLIAGVRGSGDGINTTELTLSAVTIADTLIEKLNQ
jgi:hypothetical protein